MLKRLLILVLIPLLLCSCSNYENKAKEEITFSSWGSISETQILEKIISEFEKENPEIKINFLHVPQNYYQKLHLLFASSTAPDVIFINNLYLPLYSSKLIDLSDFDELKNYYPESIKALSYKDKLLAIPRDISTLVFYRNKDLIKSEPKTLNELLEVISNSKKYGISFEPDVYYMFPYTLTMNENIYYPQKSLDFYKKLEGNYAPKRSEVGSLTLAQMFIDGNIGLYLSGRWLYPKITDKAKFNWDIISFPGIVPIDASGWAISKDSKHIDAAKKFIKYLASEKSSEYFLNTGLIVPARIETSKKIDNKIFLEVIHKSKVIDINKNYKKNIDEMNKKFF